MRLRTLTFGTLAATAMTLVLTGSANASPSTTFRTQAVAPHMTGCRTDPETGQKLCWGELHEGRLLPVCKRHDDGQYWCSGVVQQGDPAPLIRNGRR